MNYNFNFIIILLNLLFIKHITTQTESAWNIISKVEKIVIQGAARASQLYDQRCQYSNSNCLSQSYDQCSEYMPKGMETIHTEIHATECQKPGINVNTNTSGGRCSTLIPCDTQEDKILICSQGDLFENYTRDGEIKQTHLRQDPDDMIIYQYAGYINSFWKVYPFFHKAYECGSCTDYDPRQRAWYVSGITGKKNLIMIIDISETMTIKMSRMKEAVTTVINTLGFNDWFQVIFFNNDSKTIDGGNVLIQASSDNKKKILEKVEKITESGGDNFEKAFNLAFQVMKTTKSLDIVSFDCLNIIQFMTDGVITEGEKSQGKILDQVKLLNEEFNAMIFTYAFGQLADTIITQGIACQNKGISYYIDEDSDSDLQLQMSSYYIEISLEIEQKDIIWSEIYESSSLKVEMITGTAPIFYEQEDGYRKLLGVYGADLLIDQLKEQYSDFESDVLPSLLQRGRDLCIKNQIQDCKLDLLRSEKCYTTQQFQEKCPNTKSMSVKDCSSKISQGWQKENGGSFSGEYASICEGTTSSDFDFCWLWWHFVIIGITILLFIFSVVYFIRWYLKKQQRIKESKYGLETINTETDR